MPPVVVARPSVGTAADRLRVVPHRFFFLAAIVMLALVSVVWTCAIASRAGLIAAPPLAASQPVWHVLAMLFGFFPFFMFGFLFTAGPRWLAVEPPSPRVWLPLGAVAAIAALAMLVVPAPFEFATRAAAFAFGAAWLGLDLQFARLLFASKASDRVHATLVLAAMGAGASGPIAYALLGAAALPWLIFAGLWLFALPVFVAVCHRMIPFFTASALPQVAVFRPWWLLAALSAGPLLHGLLEYAGARGALTIVDGLLALLAFDLSRRWGIAQSRSNRLLAMLHAGFLWYGVAFALYAIGGMLELGGAGASSALAPLHALTMGFCGSLLLAMVTRVTFGHSGRILAADRVTWALFLLLQVAVVARIAAALSARPFLMLLAGACWVACIVAWAIRSAPLYWRPRVDGRPG